MKNVSDADKKQKCGPCMLRQGKNMRCDSCGDDMKKMTVCHQICPNCGHVVDCSDGVFD